MVPPSKPVVVEAPKPIAVVAPPKSAAPAPPKKVAKSSARKSTKAPPKTDLFNLYQNPESKPPPAKIQSFQPGKAFVPPPPGKTKLKKPGAPPKPPGKKLPPLPKKDESLVNIAELNAK